MNILMEEPKEEERERAEFDLFSNPKYLTKLISENLQKHQAKSDFAKSKKDNVSSHFGNSVNFGKNY